MKFEKRAAAGETPTEQEPQDTGKKPVIVYILILFLAAFLLMFLSLLAHQRSNSEALGKLQNSVSAIQEIQATQEQIIELQEKVDAVEKERDEAEDKLKTSEDSAAALEKERCAAGALHAAAGISHRKFRWLPPDIAGVQRPEAGRAAAGYRPGGRYHPGTAIP